MFSSSDTSAFSMQASRWSGCNRKIRFLGQHCDGGTGLRIESVPVGDIGIEGSPDQHHPRRLRRRNPIPGSSEHVPRVCQSAGVGQRLRGDGLWRKVQGTERLRIWIVSGWNHRHEFQIQKRTHLFSTQIWRYLNYIRSVRVHVIIKDLR